MGMIPALLLALAAQQFSRPDPQRHPDLYLWTDSCNVWVLKDGDRALLVDLGDGSVFDRLGDIGVAGVDAVLVTHHHREQVQGAAQLPAGVPVCAPAAERELLENPMKFRRMAVRLGDPFTIHGSSYVRPPVEPLKVDRAFQRMDTYEWRGRTFWCLDTRGNSPGSMSYLLQRGGRWLAFSGDVVQDGARMHTWFDSEWDYGFAAGIHAHTNAAGLLAGFDPELLLPSHGPAIRDGKKQLVELQAKLRALEKLYVRGYDVHTFSGAWQDKTSTPTAVPHLWRTLPHLYKFRGPNFYPNFCMVLADSGRALLVDCGLFDEKFLAESIALMKERLGLKSIDVMIPTHMHGDHFLQGPWLRKHHGTKLWALDRMAPMCENPEWFDYAAPIQAYGQKLDGVPVDRVTFDRLFKDGESFEWEGFKFTIDWMPGQTEFALAVRGVIDGKKVVFTGDNLFADPEDPKHDGHEAVVAHNSSILEEGYIHGADYLKRIAPDLIMGGHSYVMDRPAGLIERYGSWARAMRDAFKTLSSEEDYRLWYDPFWVRAEPYRVKVKVGAEVEVAVKVREFAPGAQIRVRGGGGLRVSPERAEGPFRLKVTGGGAPGVKLVAFDVTLGGRRLGERFDLIVEVVQ
jgi:glyoxylase-like metal-dependent hydrolase (beta-lactamase superfamily II)